MATYETINAISMPIPDRNPPKNRLVRSGQRIDLPPEEAKPYLEAGNIREVKDSGDEDPQASGEAQESPTGGEALVQHPVGGEQLNQEQYDELAAARPGKSARLEDWQAYAAKVPGLTVAPGAKRDEIVSAVDERLNELQP